MIVKLQTGDIDNFAIDNSPLDLFIAGQEHCKAGVDQILTDESYVSGYSFQYHLEQSNEWRERNKV